ncbi:RNA polymerase sigma factor [Chryseobacterium sp. PTM-20240506]|uniref:RNA polymerase sigma factor n=1 Tax=unclassified Chryseobacterium TaxID=2593645 RepID=UPI0023590949|nr:MULTISPECIES: sigma-70 family RNA polymerase sigma factor [unclassified Chryseobacterium]MDC8103469.1 sigma-70 family RNA polymerase sigma factor [Chryseobacterium sp. B21-037]MDQ1803022.1 sigma-70 family RNA polymerase sigma factor [Chryseobacterium sp. CKR4-1]WBV56999.1 sigma-70 family RNA polymerase sigma factor [Chryseobacterium daecheongense]
MKPTDYTLLKKIKSGDRPAFAILYERYWDSFYTMIFTRTKDRDATEELLQNLWIRILENPEFVQTDEEESAKGYLFRFIHYRILDYYASIRKIQEVYVDESEDFLAEITDAEYAEILEENDITELFAMIDEVISQLTPTEQKVYDLRIRKNMSVVETAEALNLSNKTVSNNLSKTLNEIREKLNPNYESSKKLVSLLILMEMMPNLYS